jgi:hypothetical protein
MAALPVYDDGEVYLVVVAAAAAAAAYSAGLGPVRFQVLQEPVHNGPLAVGFYGVGLVAGAASQLGVGAHSVDASATTPKQAAQFHPH